MIPLLLFPNNDSLKNHWWHRAFIVMGLLSEILLVYIALELDSSESIQILLIGIFGINLIYRIFLFIIGKDQSLKTKDVNKTNL